MRAHRQKAPSDVRQWGLLKTPAPCYICKQAYIRVHPWYHLLCPECADLNAAKREQRADLTGRRALITGGRVKKGGPPPVFAEYLKRHTASARPAPASQDIALTRSLYRSG